MCRSPWGRDQQCGTEVPVDRDRQLDQLAQHTFDSVPKHPVPLKQVHGDLAHGLEIVEEVADQREASLHYAGVELSGAHEDNSSSSRARNRSVSIRSMMAAICSLAKSPR